MHEIIDVHSEHHIKLNVSVNCTTSNVQVGGTYNDHFVVKGQINTKGPLLCICLFNDALSTSNDRMYGIKNRYGCARKQ
jgi:hypothetical protein